MTNRLSIIHSSVEPQNKNVLWLKNKTLKQWLGDGWEPILGSSEGEGSGGGDSGGIPIVACPVASTANIGGIKLGYAQSGRKYPVKIDGSYRAYVEVPWVDTVSVYMNASHYVDGLMSKEDKIKLDSFTSTAVLKMTQAEYDALGTYDDRILYIIVE